MRKPYGHLTITLPTFVITALRQLVADANVKHPYRWTVSQLLQEWLFQVLTQEEIRRITASSPAFRREVTTWAQWMVDARTGRSRQAQRVTRLAKRLLRAAKAVTQDET